MNLKLTLLFFPFCYGCFEPFVSAALPNQDICGGYQKYSLDAKCEMDFLIKYRLVTNLNKTYDVNSTDLSPLKQVDFIKTLPAIIFIHGWGSSMNDMMPLAYSSIVQQDKNALLISWESAFYSGNNYLQACSDMCCVCQKTVTFLDFVNNTLGIPLSNITLSGISMGAQLSGCMSQKIKVARITGMDPAGPEFDERGNDGRLNQGDADYVDIISTNSGGLGTAHPSGDSVFYMNCGSVQPGCMDSSTLPTDVDLTNLTTPWTCHHVRSAYYLNESMGDPGCTFWGMQMMSPIPDITCPLAKTMYACPKNNCAPMGFGAEASKLRGNFLVVTNSNYPFCEGTVSSPTILG